MKLKKIDPETIQIHIADNTLYIGERWISVNDKLPELDERVLIYQEGFIIISYLKDENKDLRDSARTRKDKYPPKIKWAYICYDPDDYNPSHWMPLPEKPNEVD